MKFTARDMAKIRLPLLGALILIITGILLAGWSASRAEKSRQERDRAAALRGQIEQKLRQVRTEEQELKERAQTFQALQTAGITGEEKRLDWTEMLRNVQHELRIPGLAYEFGVQQPLEALNGAAYAWFSSPMRLQLRLLHEEDFLRTLARIETSASAMVLIRSCNLSRLGGAELVADSLAQLKAECEMQWVTVRRGSGK